MCGNKIINKTRNRQYNGQKKNDIRPINTLQNTTQKTEQHEPNKIWVH
jgi:hypothetical protein